MPGLRGQPVRAGRRSRNRGIAQDDRCSRQAAFTLRRGRVAQAGESSSPLIAAVLDAECALQVRRGRSACVTAILSRWHAQRQTCAVAWFRASPPTPTRCLLGTTTASPLRPCDDTRSAAESECEEVAVADDRSSSRAAVGSPPVRRPLIKGAAGVSLRVACRPLLVFVRCDSRPGEHRRQPQPSCGRTTDSGDLATPTRRRRRNGLTPSSSTQRRA